MPKRTIYFVTGNKYKFKIAKEALKNFKINLIQKELETPEIQDMDIIKIASYSAVWASKILKSPVIVSDAGCYIEALNEFPGPFIKYINNYLSANDFLRLMKNHKNRKVVFKDCLAYCEPNKKPIIFVSSAQGKLATKVGKKGLTSINRIFIPDGFNRPESEIAKEEMIKFWNSNINNFEKLARKLSKSRL